MSKRFYFSAFIFCFSLLISAQTLSGDYNGYLYQNYYLCKYDKGKYLVIDSVQVDDKGCFTKSLDNKIYTPNTLYVVASEVEYKGKQSITNPHPHGSVRFIYMGEDISYQTSWRQETGYLNFLKGGEATNQINDLSIRFEKVQPLLSTT